MKNRILLFCAAFLAYVPLTNAWNAEDTQDAMRPITDEINSRLGSYLETMNRNTEIYNDRLEGIDKTIEDLRSQVAGLSKRLSDIDGKPPISNGISLPSWVLVIMAVVCAIIVAFAGLLFWPRKKVSSIVTEPSQRCPYCGWAHDPGDTVCKNPKCKMHF